MTRADLSPEQRGGSSQSGLLAHERRVLTEPHVPQPGLVLPVWDSYPYLTQDGRRELRYRVSIVEGEGEERKAFDYQDNIEGMDLSNQAHRAFVAAHLGIFLERTFGPGVTDIVRFGQPMEKEYLKLDRELYAENNVFPYGGPNEVGYYIDTTGYVHKPGDGAQKEKLIHSLRGLEHLGSAETFLDIEARLPQPQK